MYYSWIQGFWSNLTTMESCFLAQLFGSDFCNGPNHLCSLLPNPNWKTNRDLTYNKHSIYIALYFLLHHSLFTYLFVMYWELVHKALNLKYSETAFHLSLLLACKMCFYNYKLHCSLQALELQGICTFLTVKWENRDRVLPVSSN